MDSLPAALYSQAIDLRTGGILMVTHREEVFGKESIGGGVVAAATTPMSRRSMILGSGAAAAVLLGIPPAGQSLRAESLGSSHPDQKKSARAKTDTITTKDGTRIYFKDWGSGRPVVFSHGWPLSADAWDAQMLFLGQQGYRVIAHDRRGHGRSAQTWGGNDIDTYADDLAELVDALDLKGAMLVGHSTGAGEVARYVGRHGTARLSKLVLISGIPPLRLKTEANSGGSPLSDFDDLRAAVVADRSQFMKDLSMPFFGYNKPGAKISEGVRDAFWRTCMQASIAGTYDGIKTQSETDFTGDLRKIDVPTLILHGEEDQLVPVANSAVLSAKIVRNSTLKVYPGAPHGLTVTHADQLNADLLAFLKS
jgi:non-heme chloroperoxidase